MHVPRVMADSLMPPAEEIDPLRNLDLQTLQAVVPEMRERTFIHVYFHNAISAIGRLP